VAEYGWFCAPLGKEVVLITSAAACTVNVVLPVTEPCAAVMIAFPPPTADANPELLMVATAVFDDDHVTWLVMFWVLPSL
jgi:hypothetical protein